MSVLLFRPASPASMAPRACVWREDLLSHLWETPPFPVSSHLRHRRRKERLRGPDFVFFCADVRVRVFTLPACPSAHVRGGTQVYAPRHCHRRWHGEHRYQGNKWADGVVWTAQQHCARTPASVTRAWRVDTSRVRPAVAQPSKQAMDPSTTFVRSSLVSAREKHWTSPV